jgi:hypothetical protein
MAKSPAWTRKEGKNPKGGLNAKGRASAKKQGMNSNRPRQTLRPKRSATQEKLLRQNVRHEEEADERKNEARPQQPHQQKPSGVELLTWLSHAHRWVHN